MRSFIAIEMKAEAVKRVQDQLRMANADVKFVEPENLHLTLKFLGELSEDKIDDIPRMMKDSFKGIEGFEVDLKGVGVFPNPQYIRVIWVGIVKNPETLIKMHERLDENISRLGFKREGRFKPHLTIGRVKSARNKDKLADIIEKMKDEEIANIVVDKVLLKKSVLTPKGPIYSTIREVEL